MEERALVLETMMAFRRAGADMILSYYAEDVARWLRAG
jgi:porphobilinogen synthase